MTQEMSNLCLNLVLLGKTGVGKSSTGNTILGREVFTSENSSKSGTKDVAAVVGDIGGLPITVFDTPGFSGRESKEELRKYEEVLQKCELGLCAFLMVLKAGRFTEEDQEIVEKIEKLLGENRMQKTWIVFTGEDQLKDENKSINQLRYTEALKKLAQKYDDRFHNFNNMTKEPNDQVNSLISTVLTSNVSKKTQHRIPVNIQNISADSLSSRRIVLLGKSGVGKSAAGNTILGQREFISVQRMISVTSECSAAKTTVSGRSVSVVDTPGLFDTEMKPEELVTEIARSVYLSSPGPHAFLIVLKVTDRFTEHEQQIPQMIEMMFGQEVLKYSIILFTHGDQLEEQSVEKLIEESSKLRHLVQQCGGRYHIFNNKDMNNRQQVNDLLQKIDSMIEQNGGGHYSNQMYEDALTFRREEEEQRQREEEQRKQQEEKKVQEEIERVRKETEERIRAEMKAQAESQSEEERRKQEKQRKEELERVMKETEERIRADINQKRETTSQSGFFNFMSKYKSYFIMAAFVVSGIVIGALVLTGVGAALGAGVGAVVTAVSGGGLTVAGSVAGVSLTATIGGATAAGAAAAGAAAAGATAAGAAAAGAAATGAYIGAVAGVFAGGAAGAVLGTAVNNDTR